MNDKELRDLMCNEKTTAKKIADKMCEEIKLNELKKMKK